MARTLEWDEGAIIKSFYSIVSAKESSFSLPRAGESAAVPRSQILEQVAAAHATEAYTLTRQAQPQAKLGHVDGGPTTEQEADDDAEELRLAQHELQEAFAGAMSRAATGEVDEEEDEFWAAVIGDGPLPAPPQSASKQTHQSPGEHRKRRRSNEDGTNVVADGNDHGSGSALAGAPPAPPVVTLPQLEGESRKRLRAPDLQPRAVAAAAVAAGHKASAGPPQTLSAASASPVHAGVGDASQSAAAASVDPASESSIPPPGQVLRAERCWCGGLGVSGSTEREALVAEVSRVAVRAAVELLLPPPPLTEGSSSGGGSSSGDASSRGSTRLSALLQAWYQAGLHAGHAQGVAAAATASGAAASAASVGEATGATLEPKPAA